MTDDVNVPVSTPEEARLFAGKYKTVEDLEEAYKNSFKVFNENKSLKDQLSKLTSIPETYSVPDGLSLSKESLDEFISISKASNLNQDQFTTLISKKEERYKNEIESLNERRKNYGEEKINVLQDYVVKNYPKSLQDTILNTLLKDETAMSDAMTHRDKLLNSGAPGLDRGNSGVKEQYNGQEELQKLAREVEQNPRDSNLRDKYINLSREVAHSRFDKK